MRPNLQPPELISSCPQFHHHTRAVVRAQVASPDVPLSDGEFLFEPSPGMLEYCGLTAWESVVTARGGEVLLPIDNYSGTTLRIGAGEELGTLRALPAEPPITSGATPGTSAAVNTVVSTSDRCTDLLNVLQLPLDCCLLKKVSS